MERKSIGNADFVDLKNKLEALNAKSNVIHVDLSAKRRRINNIKATIDGIYDRFLCISSLVNKYNESFTITFIDILTNVVKIVELEEVSNC